MSIAPSSLPFDIEPQPSPEQLANHTPVQQIPQLQQRYISNICRTGPYPLSRHTLTDPICLGIYFFLLITTIVLFSINFFSSNAPSDPVFSELDILQKLAYSLNSTLPEILLSCLCIIAVGLIMFILVMLVPVVAGYLILLSTVGLLVFLIYSLIALEQGKVEYVIHSQTTATSIFRIVFIIITFLALFLTLYLLFKRMKKLKHVPALMSVVKVVLSQNMPLLPIVMVFLITAFNLAAWCGFTKMFWNNTRLQLAPTHTIPMVFLDILIPVMWIWTHGVLIAISDYVCQAWVLNWYFNANNDEAELTVGLKENWKLGIFKKLARFHFGTCIYGAAISPYLFQNIINTIRNVMKTRKLRTPSLQKVNYLSRYCYIETILQCFNFCQANRQSYLLRQRIKQKIPQIYMLGHFMEQMLKIFLTVGALYLWFIFTYRMQNFLDSRSTTPSFSPFMFIIFCLIIMWGIFMQISTNISHLFGMVSDVAVISYSVDSEIQRVHYHQNMPHSVPNSLKVALMKLQIEMHVYNPGIAQPFYQQQMQNVQNVQYQPQPYVQPYMENNLYPDINGQVNSHGYGQVESHVEGRVDSNANYINGDSHGDSHRNNKGSQYQQISQY